MVMKVKFKNKIFKIKPLALKNITEADVNRFIGMEIANYQSLESTINVIPIIKKYVS